MRKLFTGVLVGLVLSAGPAAQQTTPSPQTAPNAQPPLTFKVDVNYVEIDAQVTDAQGRFVRNLTKDDFQVSESGKPQTLSVFSTVDIPVEHVDPPLFAKTAIPPDVATNAHPFEGRVFVLVVDDLHTAANRTARVRAAARLFVSRYVGANDLVAVVNTSGFASGVQDFTSNRALALRAIDTAIGQKSDSATSAALDDYYRNQLGAGGSSTASADMNELERYTKARNTLATMKALADYLDGIHGRRKAVVFFSEGIDYDTTNPFAGRYARDVQDSMQQAIASATRSNVSIYSVDPRGVTSGTEDLIEIQSFPQDNSIGTSNLMEETRVQHDNLRVLSDQTGGFAVLNQNDFSNGFGRILDDNSSYYVLGYYPTNANRDGRFRSVQIKVLKPGLTVRARKGYYAPKGKAAPAKPSDAKSSAELRDVMNSPIAVSGLTIHAFAAPFRGAAPKDAVAVSIEIDGTKLPFKQSPEGLFTDDLEISMYAADAKGKIQDGAQDVLNLRLRPATHDLVSKGRFRIVRRLQLPPGKYSVRVGARETNTGMLGTVFFDFEAPDFSRAPLTMSGIAITSASGTRVPTASADPSGNDFKDVLPGPPTAMREFPPHDQLAIFAEIYDNLGKTPHRVAINASVIADDGKVVFNKSDERNSDELKGSVGGYGYTGTIPLNGLAPGRYVLRLEAKSMMGKGESVAREVEFRVQ